MTDEPDNAKPPMRHPGVVLAVTRLNAELARLLGPGTEYVLVIAQDADDLVNVQAMTNSAVARAHALLRAADLAGFDSLN